MQALDIVYGPGVMTAYLSLLFADLVFSVLPATLNAESKPETERKSRIKRSISLAVHLYYLFALLQVLLAILRGAPCLPAPALFAVDVWVVLSPWFVATAISEQNGRRRFLWGLPGLVLDCVSLFGAGVRARPVWTVGLWACAAVMSAIRVVCSRGNGGLGMLWGVAGGSVVWRWCCGDGVGYGMGGVRGAIGIMASERGVMKGEQVFARVLAGCVVGWVGKEIWSVREVVAQMMEEIVV
ncbi:hypothetical protein P153DRAFT_387775 [Dothidotthia symphoricarpi CBS 119687]|uniref:Uncharacterized protein n=1 Tax=Dothidotthia symphoricarpi CBS 119687 TaxID=1392245 RepID=A0A6A6A5S1_9PLEO|nr:uncharacterized protein P153DRAFT_387775 [Dothidotthia symphoricarpi CBS 119687]KAF2127229.1 hypothetical protein P153DRAFT_387775 [Dothidotthia symphoricarpi CBS 119687]